MCSARQQLFLQQDSAQIGRMELCSEQGGPAVPGGCSLVTIAYSDNQLLKSELAGWGVGGHSEPCLTSACLHCPCGYSVASLGCTEVRFL